MSKKYDFCGWATKNNLKCSDGRIIMKDAFKHNDGMRVPLVWHHIHDDPTNVLGYADLVNRPEGVRANCMFNDTPHGVTARELVQHGDIEGLSIYANHLTQNGDEVLHGDIKEVSLVLSGANPGAKIDYVSFAHADGTITDSEDDAIIHTGLPIEYEEDDEEDAIEHADEKEDGDDDGDSEETVEDVFNTLTDKQKNVVYAIIGELLSDEDDNEDEKDEEDLEQGDMEDSDMKKNVFDGTATGGTVITHDDFVNLMNDAKSCGSFRQAFKALDEDKRNAFLAHDGETYTGGDGKTYPTRAYGISNIGVLFPEAHDLQVPPVWIKRDTEWVSGILSGAKHSPFARVRTATADITADEARARGYITGNKKESEVFSVLKRETTPTTIYKLQKFNRDELIDVRDFDVVSWVRGEMRLMLDEEIARATLVGDGRSASSPDKIPEDKIRPIWTDDDLYTIKHTIDAGTPIEDIMDEVLLALDDYEGTGTPTLYTTRQNLTAMKLLKDEFGHRLYRNVEDIAAAMGVARVVEVPVMKNLSRTVGTGQTAYTANLFGLVVNMTDYTYGTDKGGEVNSFDDFDIDYNQLKYLIETRLSGALTLPHAAIAIEVKSA